ncbi:macrophage mannose receptor 1-like [Ptychodera flava]|uniref:macrophage mannose receptor 1-like n=1 Tax=Ptychodera flava TaxID=63121 RepID=UPI00396A81F8
MLNAESLNVTQNLTASSGKQSVAEGDSSEVESSESDDESTQTPQQKNYTLGGSLSEVINPDEEGCMCMKYEIYCQQPSDDHHYFKNARKFCKSRSFTKGLRGQLVVIRNKRSDRILRKFIKDNKLHRAPCTTNKGFWIGLDALRQDNLFIWSNNFPTCGYRNWAPNQPDYDGKNNKRCVQLSYKRGDNGKWSDEYCDSQPKGFICEIPGSYVKHFDENCMCMLYEFYCQQPDDDHPYYANAEAYCNTRFVQNGGPRGRLAVLRKSVVDLKIREFIMYNNLDGPPCITKFGFWIGLEDTLNEDEFIWSDGESHCQDDYRNWAPGEPNNNTKKK